VSFEVITREVIEGPRAKVNENERGEDENARHEEGETKTGQIDAHTTGLDAAIYLSIVATHIATNCCHIVRYERKRVRKSGGVTSGSLDPQVRLRPPETREGASENILELIKWIVSHF
jgi:hypothetical protein